MTKGVGRIANATGLSSPTEPVSAVSALRAPIPCAKHFDFREWEAVDLHNATAFDCFHRIEVQACSATRTVQFGILDHSGDYHGPDPAGVALSLDAAEEMARWVLGQIALARAASTIEARSDETGTGSAVGESVAPKGDAR